MAEKMKPNSNTVSPLFNKMDALMARHRGQSGQDIPVLTEEAKTSKPAPSALADNGLMFNPNDFYRRSAADVSDIEAALAAQPQAKPIDPLFSDSVFLDLPLLDLDGMADNPLGLPVDDSAIPTLHIEAEVDQLTLAGATVQAETLPSDEAAIVLEEVIEYSAVADETEIILTTAPDAESIADLSADDPWFNPPAPEAQIVLVEEANILTLHEEEAAPSASDEPIELVQLALAEPTGHLPDPSSVQFDLVCDEADVAAPHEEIHLTLVEGYQEPHLEITLGHHEPEPVQTHPLHVAEVVTPSAPAQAEPAPVPAPSSAKLNQNTVAEITASVGAHLAVEISTEVAHLTRQHFSSMMDKFYKDALRKMTEDIAREMDNALAPRIEEMVKEELRRQGLID